MSYGQYNEGPCRQSTNEPFYVRRCMKNHDMINLHSKTQSFFVVEVYLLTRVEPSSGGPDLWRVLDRWREVVDSSWVRTEKVGTELKSRLRLRGPR